MPKECFHKPCDCLDDTFRNTQQRSNNTNTSIWTWLGIDGGWLKADVRCYKTGNKGVLPPFSIIMVSRIA